MYIRMSYTGFSRRRTRIRIPVGEYVNTYSTLRASVAYRVGRRRGGVTGQKKIITSVWPVRDIAITNYVWYILPYRRVGGKQYIAQ